MKIAYETVMDSLVTPTAMAHNGNGVTVVADQDGVVRRLPVGDEEPQGVLDRKGRVLKITGAG